MARLKGCGKLGRIGMDHQILKGRRRPSPMWRCHESVGLKIIIPKGNGMESREEREEREEETGKERSHRLLYPLDVLLASFLHDSRASHIPSSKMDPLPFVSLRFSARLFRAKGELAHVRFPTNATLQEKKAQPMAQNRGSQGFQGGLGFDLVGCWSSVVFCVSGCRAESTYLAHSPTTSHSFASLACYLVPSHLSFAFVSPVSGVRLIFCCIIESVPIYPHLSATPKVTLLVHELTLKGPLSLNLVAARAWVFSMCSC
jgi:hypothetical protein